MLLSVTFLFSIFLASVECEKIKYDSFEGRPITDAEYKETIRKNTTFWCVTEIAPCNPKEGRRVDGSCNNLKHPTRGASLTPFYRILPADFDTDNGGYEPRKASDGGPLPLARYLRTSLLAEGKVPDQTFTQLVTHFLVYATADLVSVQDTVNYVLWRPYCCLPKGKTDPECVPNIIPAEDPVHRFSGIRCMNLTRPITYQSVGCIKNGSVPERVSSATPLLDLSQLYGAQDEELAKKGRKFTGGLLKYEIEDGRIWPPSTKKDEVSLCRLNQPTETRCHDTPGGGGSNSIVGGNLFTIWFWRNHNNIANALSEVNPCWNDEKLFYTARDINIATYTQIFYYEILPILMGKHNLLRDDVISSSPGFRDLYNDQLIPQIALELPFVGRWFHNMQEGALNMYDQDGHYIKEIPVVNMTLRTGYLAVDNNIDYMTQGSFRQPCAKGDNVVDPDIAELGLGPQQLASDIVTSDLSKNRYFGFKPYVDYRKWCYGKSFKNFDDLKDFFDPEKLELLKDRYKSVEDIDLMAGLWLERHVPGGHVPETLYCIMADQLHRSVVSDRHWYESSGRPYAFTLEQLSEIRKASVSRLLCDVGDKVTRIQPHGFVRAGHRNQICSCEEIEQMDFSVWEDESCADDYRKRK